MKYVLTLTLTCMLLLPSLVRAEGPSVPTELHYQFEDQVVAGDYPVPREVFVNLRKRAERTTLVAVRTQFVPELLKSVEDL